MGFFRLRRSVKIAPGVRLNFSRSGVSTTLGVRGLSVNTGRRGTFLNAGIPGTGIHSRSRLGGSGRRGGSAATGGAGSALAGCMGCGGIGFVMLLFVGFCGSIASHPGGGAAEYTPLSTVDSHAQREALYARAPVNVRSGAGTSHAIARKLSRGDRIEAGPRDSGGWAEAYDWSGRRLGYVHLPSTRLTSSPPSTEREERPRSRRRSERGAPSGASAICGDGSYSFSAHRRGTCSHHGGVAQWL